MSTNGFGAANEDLTRMDRAPAARCGECILAEVLYGVANYNHEVLYSSFRASRP